MNRIPPSQQIKQAIRELLQAGVQGDDDVLHTLLRLGAQRLVQEVLEQEIEDLLGRSHYEHRTESSELAGYRNGYRARKIKTAEGAIPIAVPQLRQTELPFVSRLLPYLRGNTAVLERLVAEIRPWSLHPGY